MWNRPGKIVNCYRMQRWRIFSSGNPEAGLKNDPIWWGQYSDWMEDKKSVLNRNPLSLSPGGPVHRCSFLLAPPGPSPFLLTCHFRPSSRAQWGPHYRLMFSSNPEIHLVCSCPLGLCSGPKEVDVPPPQAHAPVRAGPTYFASAPGRWSRKSPLSLSCHHQCLLIHWIVPTSPWTCLHVTPSSCHSICPCSFGRKPLEAVDGTPVPIYHSLLNPPTVSDRISRVPIWSQHCPAETAFPRVTHRLHPNPGLGQAGPCGPLSPAVLNIRQGGPLCSSLNAFFSGPLGLPSLLSSQPPSFPEYFLPDFYLECLSPRVPMACLPLIQFSGDVPCPSTSLLSSSLLNRSPASPPLSPPLS